MPVRKELSFSDILELQVKGLKKLDTQTLARLEPVLLASQDQLSRELNKYSEDQYSYQHRLQTIQQINNALNRMYNEAEAEFYRAGEEFNEFGHEMAKTEVKAFNDQVGIATPSIKRDVTSLGQNEFLINNAKASLQTYTADIRYRVSNALTQGVLMKKTGYEITGRLSKFMDIKKYRIQRIVRTELSKIFNQTKLIAYGEFKEQHFPDMMKRLFHPMDSRTADDSKQLARLDPAVPLNKPFVFKYRYVRKDGSVRIDKRIFMTPPDRPNDRAVMVPFRKSWKQDN